MIKVPFGIAATSVGLGLVGDTLNSQGLIEGGQAAGKFIAPAVNISMGGYLVRQLKDIKGGI